MNASQPEPINETTVKLGDERLVTLRRDAVEEAAGHLTSGAHTSEQRDPEPAPDRVTVVVDGVHHEALILAAKALNVDGDLLRPRSIYQALRTLGYSVEEGEGADPASSGSRTEGRRRPLPGPESADPERDELDQDDGEPVERDDITPEAAIALQRLHGQWVAIREGRVLHAARTLKEVHLLAGDQDVSIVFVPARAPEES